MPPAAQTLPPIVPPAPLKARGLPLRRLARPAAGSEMLTRGSLRQLFWLTFAGLILTVCIKAPGQAPEGAIGALLIIGAAMFPSYLWVSGKVRGLPLFPACALTCTWAFALSLVSEHPMIVAFPGSNQLVAALSVTAFLLSGTLTWYVVARRPFRPPAVCWTMDEAQKLPLLLGALAFCAAWTVANSAGWVYLSIGLESLSRAILIAVEALCCFILSYRLGCRRLSGPSKAVFFTLLGILFVANLPGLLLIVPMSLFAVAVMAYVVASKKLPWRVILAGLCVFGFLHVGKTAMREKHWRGDEPPAIQPLQYPGFLAEWVTASAEAMRQGAASEERGETLLERASLMHWLLHIQASTPSVVPYLDGATYAVIPRLFVPRLFDPDKPRSHEATYMLAIHYGIQTREDTEFTTIAFGMLNESYANFGFYGIVALGMTLGAFYGKVAHWARGMPILSFRALFAVLVASYTFQAEFTSTYFVSALFQSTVVLLLLSAVFMRRRRVSDAQASLLE